MKIFLLFTSILVVLLYNQVHAQRITKHVVYFEVDSYVISPSEKTLLENFIKSEASNDFISKVRIQGHTDSDASNDYNQKLSAKRVKSVQQLFEGTELVSKIESYWTGEDEPVNNNLTDAEKRMNRRVEITIEHWIPDLVESSGSIKDLYKLLEQEKQVFCIHPKGDTVIRLEQGTIVSFPPYPFGDIDVPCVQIRMKECYKKSDMILENLSTSSNGRMLESAGMVYIEAAIQDSLIELAPGKEVSILMPTDELRDDMQGFNGERDPHSDVMNWLASNATNFSRLSMPPGEDCLNRERPSLNCTRCKFFFCRFTRIDEGLKGVINRPQHQDNKTFRECQRLLRRTQGNPNTQLDPQMDQNKLNCEKLDSLLKKYGVTNRSELMEAMNKELMDEYGVKTLEELRDTLNKIKLKNIELNLSGGKVNQSDLQYYMFNSSRLGWINTDAFSKLSGERITMQTDLNANPRTDCKAVFTGVRGILPALNNEKQFQFYNVPKNNEIWLIGMRFENNQAYLSMQKMETAENVQIGKFRKVTLQEMKEALRVID